MYIMLLVFNCTEMSYDQNDNCLEDRFALCSLLTTKIKVTEDSLGFKKLHGLL